MDLMLSEADTDSASTSQHEEHAVRIQDSFSEGLIYPGRALALVVVAYVLVNLLSSIQV